MLNKFTFKFLNKPEIITRMVGITKNKEKLWNYNLHYFDDLNAKDFNKRSKWHQLLINDWIENNLPFAGALLGTIHYFIKNC